MLTEIETELRNKIIAPDSSFKQMITDYNDVKISIEEGSGRMVTIIAKGYVTLEQTVHWDENIIERIEVNENTVKIKAVLNEVLTKYKNYPFGGGGIRKIDGPWYELKITFIDDFYILVIAQDIEIETDS